MCKARVKWALVMGWRIVFEKSCVLKHNSQHSTTSPSPSIPASHMHLQRRHMGRCVPFARLMGGGQGGLESAPPHNGHLLQSLGGLRRVLGHGIARVDLVAVPLGVPPPADGGPGPGILAHVSHGAYLSVRQDRVRRRLTSLLCSCSVQTSLFKAASPASAPLLRDRTASSHCSTARSAHPPPSPARHSFYWKPERPSRWPPQELGPIKAIHGKKHLKPETPLFTRGYAYQRNACTPSAVPSPPARHLHWTRASLRDMSHWPRTTTAVQTKSRSVHNLRRRAIVGTRIPVAKKGRQGSSGGIRHPTPILLHRWGPTGRRPDHRQHSTPVLTFVVLTHT